MSDSYQLSRRDVLTGLSATGLASFAGCTTIMGDTGDGEATPDDPPVPVIVDATTEVANFRQTRSESKTVFILQNDGGLGEFEAKVVARGKIAVLDRAVSLFSLEAGQKHQLGFDLFTHEGANQIEITVTPTNNPDASTTHIISEEKNTDEIDYQEQ